jgi:hypothetical protein
VSRRGLVYIQIWMLLPGTSIWPLPTNLYSYMGQLALFRNDGSDELELVMNLVSESGTVIDAWWLEST